MAYTPTKLSYITYIFDRIVRAYIILTSGTRKAVSATESAKTPTKAPLGWFYQSWSVWLVVKETQWPNNRKIYHLTKEEV